MIVNDAGSSRPFLPLEQQQKAVNPPGDEKGFASTVKEFITDVNSMQIDAKKGQEAFLKGEPVDIHDVMINAEKAKTSFNLLMEIRNKFLDLYREVNRMQV